MYFLSVSLFSLSWFVFISFSVYSLSIIIFGCHSFNHSKCWDWMFLAKIIDKLQNWRVRLVEICSVFFFLDSDWIKITLELISMSKISKMIFGVSIVMFFWFSKQVYLFTRSNIHLFNWKDLQKKTVYFVENDSLFKRLCFYDNRWTNVRTNERTIWNVRKRCFAQIL